MLQTLKEVFMTLKKRKGYKAIDVSRFIIYYCQKKNNPVSNLRLQKMLYFIQSYYLCKKNRPCFKDNIEAWRFGPVVPNVYHQFKNYGALPIPHETEYLSYENNEWWNATMVKYSDNMISPADKKIISEIVDELSEFSSSHLVETTHSQKPWKDAYQIGNNTIITNEALKGYFWGKWK